MQGRLLCDLRRMIAAARAAVARQVNATLVTLYWNVGRRIRQDILRGKRASYGEEVLKTLSVGLSVEFGEGFSQRNLAYMVRFAEAFPDDAILHALSAKLSWTHFRQIVSIEDPLKRDFYAQMCRLEGWSTRTLEKKISGMLYERTALSRRPTALICAELDALKKKDLMGPDLVFRDPYLLDFLGLKDTYGERDLESAILREMESFILELGAGFSFIARQRRMTIDGVDYHLDLLFYHRPLGRLVAIELKLGNFKAEHMGQMELYLRWLAKNEAGPGERAPIGLILCAGKSEEHVELLELDQGRLRVATYITELPPKDVLAKKLHSAIEAARARAGQLRS